MPVCSNDYYGEKKTLKMNDALSFPLGPLPWVLASVDGSLRRTNKSSLAKEHGKDLTAADMIHNVNRARELLTEWKWSKR